MTIPKSVYIIFIKYDKKVTLIGLHIMIINLSKTVNVGSKVIKSHPKGYKMHVKINNILSLANTNVEELITTMQDNYFV